MRRLTSEDNAELIVRYQLGKSHLEMKNTIKKKRAPGAGPKPKDAAGKKVPLGVSRVAPDVATRIAAAPDRVAFLEALVRAAPPA